MNDNRIKKVVISGATGFVGSYLCRSFRDLEWDVTPLSRDDLSSSSTDLAEKISGAKLVINLAGAPVIHRWTPAYKNIMYESRITVTQNLVTAIQACQVKPQVLVSTSAVGYYSSEGTHDEEEYVAADNFLGEMARDWEAAALAAQNFGVRTIIFRFGVVLGKEGGALGAMLPLFKLGLGGKIGDGSQSVSWIHIKDLFRAYLFVADDETCVGNYNLTSPNPITNARLTTVLGKALHRPTFFVVPKFILCLRFGAGAQILTSGQKVIPRKLLNKGFEFLFPEIQQAVDDCFGQEDV